MLATHEIPLSISYKDKTLHGLISCNFIKQKISIVFLEEDTFDTLYEDTLSTLYTDQLIAKQLNTEMRKVLKNALDYYKDLYFIYTQAYCRILSWRTFEQNNNFIKVSYRDRLESTHIELSIHPRHLTGFSSLKEENRPGIVKEIKEDSEIDRRFVTPEIIISYLNR